MSEASTSLQNGGYSTVPLEPPPAYEPKPDDVDVEQDTNSRREDRAARVMAFFSRYKPYWQKPALYLVLAVISLWFTVVILNAFGVRRSGILYSNSYSEEYRYRPAASPVITQTLGDGRTLVRGAEPTSL